jgi:hypothetical protein
MFKVIQNIAGNETSVNIALSISENNQCYLGSLFSRRLDLIILMSPNNVSPGFKFNSPVTYYVLSRKLADRHQRQLELSQHTTSYSIFSRQEIVQRQKLSQT